VSNACRIVVSKLGVKRAELVFGIQGAPRVDAVYRRYVTVVRLAGKSKVKRTGGTILNGAPFCRYPFCQFSAKPIANLGLKAALLLGWSGAFGKPGFLRIVGWAALV
jgi:hypothetical protein